MSWVRPRALRPGDLIGLAAPGGPVDKDRLAKGAAALESLGFRTRAADGILDRSRFTAGSIERRVAELHTLFGDDAVAGIVCARGGAGAAHVLPHLDANLLRAHPKVFCGYSDITFLHLFMNRLGLVTFHGPMAAHELADGSYHEPSLRHGLLGEGAPYASESDDLIPLRPGKAEGILRGGCLSILAGAVGTAWALDTSAEDTVLFLEDRDEKPYRIDRMLWQLRRAGAFARVRGIVFGDMKGCAPSLREDYSLEDVILAALDGLNIPMAMGLSSGHTAAPNVTLPLGVRVRLSCGDEAAFEVLEPALA